MSNNPVWGDNWTGAGQNSASQIRDWNWGGPVFNWTPGPVPPPWATNVFGAVGEGQINLNGLQWTGGMVFNDFTYPIIAPGLLLPARLTTVDDSIGNSTIKMGEGVRDTYGVDYFTAGPQFTAEVMMNNGTTDQVDVVLGNNLGSDSSMMFSGPVTGMATPNLDTFAYTGSGKGTSVWIASVGTGLNPVVVSPAVAGVSTDGYALHFVGGGQIGGNISLMGEECYLGLHNNAGKNYGSISVDAYWGNIFTDRDYQTNDLDTTVNAQQYIPGTVTMRRLAGTVGAMAVFGTSPTGALKFGRTNNGFTIRVDTLQWATDPDTFWAAVRVNNGNLTEERGGSRFVSGANRLQEAHNYTYVDNLREDGVLFMGKMGRGVLAVRHVGNGAPGWQVWLQPPTVGEGVLRMGTPTLPHNAPSVSCSADAGVGIGWNTNIDLRGVWGGGIQPFTINALVLAPAYLVPGQTGALDIDMWGHNAGIIDTNVWNPNPPNNLYYLRVGSSMGGDASFNTQPIPAKHASVAFLTPGGAPTQIIPYIVQQSPDDIYYFGGGGGTLRVDSQLVEYEDRQAWLEMGTTWTLLPGRVALNPGGDVNPLEANLYRGPTEVCAGTLQLMKRHSVFNTAMVHVWTYDLDLTNGLYANPGPYHHPWEGAGRYAWTGPGQLLLDPGRDPQNPNPQDWSLFWYTAQGGAPLFNALSLDGGVIGWTGNVDLVSVPGNYGTPINSNLKGAPQWVNVLGLGGEYSAGVMMSRFTIGDSQQGTPVLLYKAGKNSTLDFTNGPLVNTYTGGTIIAGGEVRINAASQLNADEANVDGGPIAILNGGRLHCTMPAQGSDIFINVPIMVNTDGTPDRIENCGSVIEVDGGVTTWLFSNFDFSWNPSAYLEKDGSGILNYRTPPPVAGPNNAWGLKLTAGLIVVNQLPVNPGLDCGPVICNNGNLQVAQVPVGMMFDMDPAYGFRNIVSFKGTSSTVIVDDDAMFRTHGSVPNEILGTVKFIGQDLDGIVGNNFVHLSRNMAPAGALMPADAGRGNGVLAFQDVQVYMSSNAAGLNVLPREAGFKLILNDGTTFHGSTQNPVFGEVNFNNMNPSRPVQINGAEAAATPLTSVPYTFALTDQTWSIEGTGYTTWSGTIEKIGTGTVEFNRQQGAPVAVNATTLLRIVDGTLVARGTADPFTDTVTGFSLDIENNSQNDGAGIGLEISEGTKTVDLIFGTGDLWVWDPLGTGTTLNATSITQNSINIGGTPPPHAVAARSVPEPSAMVLLVLAAMGGLTAIRRNR